MLWRSYSALSNPQSPRENGLIPKPNSLHLTISGPTAYSHRTHLPRLKLVGFRRPFNTGTVLNAGLDATSPKRLPLLNFWSRHLSIIRTINSRAGCHLFSLVQLPSRVNNVNQVNHVNQINLTSILGNLPPLPFRSAPASELSVC